MEVAKEIPTTKGRTTIRITIRRNMGIRTTIEITTAVEEILGEITITKTKMVASTTVVDGVIAMAIITTHTRTIPTTMVEDGEI